MLTAAVGEGSTAAAMGDGVVDDCEAEESEVAEPEESGAGVGDSAGELCAELLAAPLCATGGEGNDSSSAALLLT